MAKTPSFLDQLFFGKGPDAPLDVSVTRRLERPGRGKPRNLNARVPRGPSITAPEPNKFEDIYNSIGQLASRVMPTGGDTRTTYQRGADYGQNIASALNFAPVSPHGLERAFLHGIQQLSGDRPQGVDTEDYINLFAPGAGYAIGAAAPLVRRIPGVDRALNYLRHTDEMPADPDYVEGMFSVRPPADFAVPRLTGPAPDVAELAVPRLTGPAPPAAPRARQKPQVRTDNPGGDWLKYQRQRSDESGMKVSGAVTGYLERPIELDPQKLAVIPGASGERRVPGDPQYDNLRPLVEREGLRPDSPILVGINHRGEPYIIEGNTRTAVARDLGLRSVPAEVRYFAGGEQVGGLMEPGLLEHYMPPSELSLDPNFRRFFEGSQAVDEYGEPRMFFHGSNVRTGTTLGSPFSVFDRMAVPNLLTNRRPSMDNVGSWFSDRADDKGAGMYAGSSLYDDMNPYIMPVYLNYANPWKPSSFDGFMRIGNALSGREYDPAARPGAFDPEALRKWLKESGYDSIQFPRGLDGGDQVATVVLEPTQIKSATGNRGTYDPNDPDIRKARGGRVRNPLSVRR